MRAKSIQKVLSANDVGKTGGHQAGILIPKKDSLLSFFPAVDSSSRNPRVHIEFRDDRNTVWTFAFIYYNNRLFGGTRNEYRLTRMTRFLRENKLVEGDRIELHRDADGEYSVSCCTKEAAASMSDNTDHQVLTLGPKWRVIKI